MYYEGIVKQSSTPIPLTPIRKILHPFEQFLRIESSGGILLLAAAATALIWANVPHGAESYVHLWHTPISVVIGNFTLTLTLAHWINDSLMSVFFFVVGLEIKREMLAGELTSPRQAVLPIAAAIGGMIVPALFYTAFNANGPGAAGWGIPMATDIAFAVGVMALLGSRAPLSLKIFITALAIVDDLGAVVVIALFYTAQLNFISLAIAGGLMVLMFIMNRAGFRTPAAYLVIGVGLWLALLDSGMHASLSGVLAALAIPSRRHIDGKDFLARGRQYLDEFESAGASGSDIIPNAEQHNAMYDLETSIAAARSPMARLEHLLHPWVMYCIMPIFALANAGVVLVPEGATNQPSLLGLLAQPVSIGVMVGLFLGKPIGILLASWIAVRSGFGALPRGVGWTALLGAGCLAGIGFTMSLFIANLGLPEGVLLTEAKLGFLAASVASGIVGSAILLFAPKPETVH